MSELTSVCMMRRFEMAWNPIPGVFPPHAHVSETGPGYTATLIGTMRLLKVSESV